MVEDEEVANDSSLDQFDVTIEELHRFEELRYPDEDPAASKSLRFAPTRGGHYWQKGDYVLHLDELDRLVRALFELGKRNPKAFAPFTKSGYSVLLEANVEALAWGRYQGSRSEPIYTDQPIKP